MIPFYTDEYLTLWGGDCREVLRELPAESVHCVVTSPPYWGLRDYGTASWDGGDPECDHEGPAKASTRSTLKNDGRPAELVGQNDYERAATVPFRVTCGKCGARRIDSQLGLEATPEEFVANMVGVFREVRRVLRKDGTLWLNLGDSYGTGAGPTSDKSTLRGNGHVGGGPKRKALVEAGVETTVQSGNAALTFKPKDLVGIPWRVAFALQADGWYLRSDIIWAKPNPMPESVTDRPTKAHEYLFLLTRSPRYYYDAEAVREPQTTEAQGMDRKPPPNKGHANSEFGERAAGLAKNGWIPNGYNNPAGRNLRSVWSIATEPYPGAHFATFPRKLVEPCVKAGTSERGVCPECGAPWVRILETITTGVDPRRPSRAEPDGRMPSQMRAGDTETHTLTWTRRCTHEADPVPAVVLDPFAGSGTTLLVAQSLGRRGVGIDLSPDYLKQALERNRQTPLGLVG